MSLTGSDLRITALKNLKRELLVRQLAGLVKQHASYRFFSSDA